MMLKSLFVLIFLGCAVAADANGSKAISDIDLQSIIRENAILNFAGSGQVLEIDERYSVAALAQSPKTEGGHIDFYKGRRYALVVLDRNAKQVLVVLESGELERNHEPFPTRATLKSAEFSFIDMYTEFRRVRFEFDAPGAREFSKMELPASGTADVL